MNFSDSEIVASILHKEGFSTTKDISEADVVFLNTCSIREKAEITVRNRLNQINGLKNGKPHLLVGVLGCMAERLKSKFLEEEKIVDLVAGPAAAEVEIQQAVKLEAVGHRRGNRGDRDERGDEGAEECAGNRDPGVRAPRAPRNRAARFCNHP